MSQEANTTVQIHRIFINATPERVWAAIKSVLETGKPMESGMWERQADAV